MYLGQPIAQQACSTTRFHLLGVRLCRWVRETGCRDIVDLNLLPSVCLALMLVTLEAPLQLSQHVQPSTTSSVSLEAGSSSRNRNVHSQTALAWIGSVTMLQNPSSETGLSLHGTNWTLVQVWNSPEWTRSARPATCTWRQPRLLPALNLQRPPAAVYKAGQMSHCNQLLSSAGAAHQLGFAPSMSLHVQRSPSVQLASFRFPVADHKLAATWWTGNLKMRLAGLQFFVVLDLLEKVLTTRVAMAICKLAFRTLPSTLQHFIAVFRASPVLGMESMRMA
jgi:hypothetical protein